MARANLDDSPALLLEPNPALFFRSVYRADSPALVMVARINKSIIFSIYSSQNSNRLKCKEVPLKTWFRLKDIFVMAAQSYLTGPWLVGYVGSTAKRYA